MKTIIKSIDDLLSKKKKLVEVQTLTLGPDEYLLVRVPEGTSTAQMHDLNNNLKAKLRTERIITYNGDVSFAKIKLQEEIVEKMLLGGQIKP